MVEESKLHEKGIMTLKGLIFQKDIKKRFLIAEHLV
jgi:hypothetical protein